MSESKSNQSQRHYQERAERALERARKASPPPAGELVQLPPRSLESAFKLEQNLGCELPVCVSNRKDVDGESIEVTTDEGVTWKLVRTADSKLPAPEHYLYWLWFLDRCQAAAEKSQNGEPPRIILEPMEIFDLFSGGAHGGMNYTYLDDAFTRFSRMVISVRAAFFEGDREYESRANLGTLCYYSSWRSRPRKDQKAFEFSNGWIAPGQILWDSINFGYIKSVPLKPLRELSYVAQRLYTFLSKHCKPGGEFAISPAKLLPKIPTVVHSRVQAKMAPHHEALAKVGFLSNVTFEGRGQSKLIIYKRTVAGCRHFWPEAPSEKSANCPGWDM
jgi:hypothetical protein